MRSFSGENNPNWKGDAAASSTGNDRARRWYPKTLPCEICGKAAERHHKDGNSKNNKYLNIEFLCRKHHMEADGRLEKLIKLSKVAQPIAALAAGAVQRAKIVCKYGHLLSGDNLEICDRGNGKDFRVCKTCRRRRDREKQRKMHGFSPWQPGKAGRPPIDVR